MISVLMLLGIWPGSLTLGAEIELPELGDTSSGIVSQATERQIGEDLLKQIRAQLPTVNDPILKYYTEINLYHLAEFSRVNEAVLYPVLIDSPQINAFAAPGGVVGINLGLYLYARDVNEFDSVLAHELAHLSQRHFARGIEQQRQQTLPYMASMLGAILIAATAGGDAGLAAVSSAQALVQGNQLRYSRSREAEADRIGIDTMARAGLDPRASGRMFERMQRAYQFARRPPEFLLTHPVTESRIADARNQSAKYPDRAYPDSPEYQMMRARAEVHYAPTAAQAVSLFRGRLERKENPDIARYGLAVALSRARKGAEAVDTMRLLYLAHPNSIILTASYADILLHQGRHADAITLLSQGLAINPDNAPYSMLLAAALAKDEQYQKAEAILKRQSVLHPNDQDVWYQLAELSGLAGDIVEVHQARAEFFALVGNYRNAIKHLEYARGLVNKDDFQLTAKLDQRILDFRDQLQERSRS